MTMAMAVTKTRATIFRKSALMGNSQSLALAFPLYFKVKWKAKAR